ncbi:MAG: BlaI/MecI/CopY family transcriptional regulator [Candidatus Aenigmatarchaeota archaeon]
MRKTVSKKIAQLSPLENSILGVLWKSGEGMRVRELHAKLKNIPLTSIAVTLDRLHKKSAVIRASEKGRGGTHYIYSAIPKESFQRSMVAGVMDRLVENFGSVAVNYFNEKYGKGKK